VKVKGIEKVGGHPAYKVGLTAKDGTKKVHYYDAETFLLLRSESVGELQSAFGRAAVPSDEFFSDYREVNGAKFPFQSRRVTIGDVTRYSEIQVNVELDDSMFQVPTRKKK